MHIESVFTGNMLTIGILVHDDQSCPVREFLEALSDSERCKADVLFERLGNFGRITNNEKFKKIEGSDGLFEFKIFQIRLICFYTPDKKVAICSALRKKKDKHKASDLERAEELKTALFGAMKYER